MDHEPPMPIGNLQQKALENVRNKAHEARLIDLTDYDWMSLDVETALKIHTLLPRDW